jgi:hypothetical protein
MSTAEQEVSARAHAALDLMPLLRPCQRLFHCYYGVRRQEALPVGGRYPNEGEWHPNDSL